MGRDSSLEPKLLFKNGKWFLIPLFLFIILLGVYFFILKREKFIFSSAFNFPEDLSPAEVGKIINNTINYKDLISLIFYWAAKGYIKIKEVTVLGNKDWRLKKLQDIPRNETEKFERTLFRGVFKEEVIRVGEINNSKVYKAAAKAKEELEEGIRKKDIYREDERRLCKFLKGAGIFSILVGFIFLIVSYNVRLFMTLLLSAGIFYLFGVLIPSDIKTKKGINHYRQLKRLQNYLKRVDRQEVEKLAEKNTKSFYQLLAYSISLHVEEEWLNKVEQVIHDLPSWYEIEVELGKDSKKISSFLDTVGVGIVSIENAFINMDYHYGGSSNLFNDSGGGFTSGSGGGGAGGTGGAGGVGGGGGGAW